MASLWSIRIVSITTHVCGAIKRKIRVILNTIKCNTMRVSQSGRTLSDYRLCGPYSVDTVNITSFMRYSGMMGTVGTLLRWYAFKTYKLFLEFSTLFSDFCGSQ